MSAYFVLSPVLPRLLLCPRLVPDPFHGVEEVQSSRSCSQGQDFQMIVELIEDHTKL